MENQIKYTPEGKKVIVLAKIESTNSFIVREMYIADGVEIPLGEIFGVTKLFDEAPKTWQEKRIEEIKISLEKEERSFKEKIAQFDKKKQTVLKHLKNQLDYFQRLINTWNRNPNTEILYKTFDTLSSFVLGKIKYFVVVNYGIKIVKYEDYMNDKDGEIRLISLFGKDQGSLNWGVNQYGDGSGTNYRVIPCETLKKAKEEFLNYVNKKENYHPEDLGIARKHKIKLDPIKVKQLKQSQRIRIEAQIQDTEKRIEVQQLEIKRLKLQLRAR